MFTRLLAHVRDDLRTAVEKDPAAKSRAEALLYPGLHAVWAHRVWHRIHRAGHPLLARALSQCTRFLTGVEIHPAADLGRRVFIDHGMGVVVGETAEVGDDVHLFHGVTLGGDDPEPVKRHPTVGDGVTIGANATLIGDIEVGDEATVGAGAVVVDDVPAGETVAGNPAQVTDTDGGQAPGRATVARSDDRPGGPLADGTATERASDRDDGGEAGPDSAGEDGCGCRAGS